MKSRRGIYINVDGVSSFASTFTQYATDHLNVISAKTFEETFAKLDACKVYFIISDHYTTNALLRRNKRNTDITAKVLPKII